MKSNARKYLVCLVFLCSFLIGISAACLAMTDKVLVVVNEEVVTQREFDRAFAPIKKSYEANFTGEELAKRLEAVKKGLLEQMVNSKLVISLAKEGEIEIDEAELKERLDKIRAFYPSEEEFLQALNQKGTNLTEFEKEMREQMLAQKLIEQEISSKIVITPADIRDLYEKNKEQLIAPKSLQIRSIMVRKSDDPEKDREKIEEILKEIKAGKDFASLATERSEGPYASSAGNMGYVYQGQLLKEIEDAVFALDKGGTTDIVETSIGYHIFRVEDVKESRTMDLSEVTDFLRQQLYMKRFEDDMVKWIKEKRDNAYIDYK